MYLVFMFWVCIFFINILLNWKMNKEDIKEQDKINAERYLINVKWAKWILFSRSGKIYLPSFIGRLASYIYFVFLIIVTIIENKFQIEFDHLYLILYITIAQFIIVGIPYIYICAKLDKIRDKNKKM